jgi:FAD/FMN-containing dehydrogenase
VFPVWGSDAVVSAEVLLLVTDLLDDLRGVVGATHVITDPAVASGYETDWTGRFSGRALCVVRPASADEVAGCLTSCTRAGVPVVVQGGNTGLVGGGVPAGGEVVLVTRRLAGVGPVDVAGRVIEVGAGASLAAVQAAVRPHGLDVGVDLGARESATVGGMVATNAGGERVLRHGSMREQVAGVSAVLADGTVLELRRPLPKEATGYDLSSVLVGSEGTLAVLVAVRLRLVALAGVRAVALAGVGSVTGALDVLSAARDAMAGTLESAELLTARGLDLVLDHTGLPRPLVSDHAAYVLLEAAAAGVEAFRLAEQLAGCLASVGVADAVVATEPQARSRLWRYREAHSEAVAAVGVPLKLDVAVPLVAMPAFVDELGPLVREVAPDSDLVVFGHLAEGNLHVNVLGAGDVLHTVTDVVLRRVAALGGSISAEHGVGRAKVSWLALSRTPAELSTMRRLKQAFDPAGLLSPGVLLPPVSADG